MSPLMQACSRLWNNIFAWRAIKGVIWCDFLFSFSLVCYVAVCACIRSAELQSSKSPTKGFILSKREARSRSGKKRLIQTRPHRSKSQCGNICIMPANVHAKKEGVVSVTAVVLMQSCQFLSESKITLFGLPKLKICLQQNSTTKFSNLRNAFYWRQFREPRRVQGWLCTKAIKNKNKNKKKSVPTLLWQSGKFKCRVLHNVE